MNQFKLRELESLLQSAVSYTEWRDIAVEHDRVSGMSDWCSEEESPLYDNALIRDHLQILLQLMKDREDVNLLQTLNEGIHGNLGGMGSPELYQRAKFGTKSLVTEYIDAVIGALDIVHNSNHPALSFSQKVDFFRRASHCFGRSALMLSGGATQGIFHIGVVKSLLEENLLPKVISGASAGSVIAATVATHSDDELKDILHRDQLRFETMKFLGWSNILQGVPLLDAQHLESALSEYVEDLTFEEAYQKTKRNLNICISPARYQQESRMLNAISSPSVHIRKGVMASCAVPGLFPPVTLTAKNIHGETHQYNPRRQWVDGSLSNDQPSKRLTRIYGVNHYIASQTNPHVVPFIAEKGGKKTVASAIGSFGAKTTKQLVSHILKVGRGKITSPVLGVALTQIHALVSQDYTADIVLYPPYRFINPLKLFVDPTPERINQLILEGERATWPKIEMIRNCTKISRKLDEILSQYDIKEREKMLGQGDLSVLTP